MNDEQELERMRISYYEGFSGEHESNEVAVVQKKKKTREPEHRCVQCKARPTKWDSIYCSELCKRRFFRELIEEPGLDPLDLA